MTYDVADWKSHVTGQLNNMQIKRRQWIALWGAICPVERATGSPCARMHGHWVSMKPFGLLPPIPNLQTLWWTTLLWECLASTLDKWTRIFLIYSDLLNVQSSKDTSSCFADSSFFMETALAMNRKFDFNSCVSLSFTDKIIVWLRNSRRSFQEIRKINALLLLWKFVPRVLIYPAL